METPQDVLGAMIKHRNPDEIWTEWGESVDELRNAIAVLSGCVMDQNKQIEDLKHRMMKEHL
jgi:hypothetical protein